MIKIKHNGAKGAKSTQFKTKQLLTRAVDQSRLWSNISNDDLSSTQLQFYKSRAT